MKFKKKRQNEIHHMGIIMVIINLFSKISKGFNIFFSSYGILEVKREIYFILTTSLILFSILILCDK